LQDNYTWLDQPDGVKRGSSGNIVAAVKYRALLDAPHEFFFTAAVDREFGDSGARASGATRQGSTMPTVYFAKGLGDLDIGYLRPLGVVGMARYQISDGAPRADRVLVGASIEYSIPYLQSKVRAFDLPDLLRRVTPMVEALASSPVGSSYGGRTTALVAPGFSYAGEGWEFGMEALLPVTRPTGRGVGVIAQLYLSLDYLMADSPIGRPMLSAP
jgi:hypothetical protein